MSRFFSIIQKYSLWFIIIQIVFSAVGFWGYYEYSNNKHVYTSNNPYNEAFRLSIKKTDNEKDTLVLLQEIATSIEDDTGYMPIFSDISMKLSSYDALFYSETELAWLHDILLNIDSYESMFSDKIFDFDNLEKFVNTEKGRDLPELTDGQIAGMQTYAFEVKDIVIEKVINADGTKDVSVILKNTGESIWKKEDVFLITANPYRYNSPFYVEEEWIGQSVIQNILRDTDVGEEINIRFPLNIDDGEGIYENFAYTLGLKRDDTWFSFSEQSFDVPFIVGYDDVEDIYFEGKGKDVLSLPRDTLLPTEKTFTDDKINTSLMYIFHGEEDVDKAYEKFLKSVSNIPQKGFIIKTYPEKELLSNNTDFIGFEIIGVFLFLCVFIILICLYIFPHFFIAVFSILAFIISSGMFLGVGSINFESSFELYSICFVFFLFFFLLQGVWKYAQLSKNRQEMLIGNVQKSALFMWKRSVPFLLLLACMSIIWSLFEYSLGIFLFESTVVLFFLITFVFLSFFTLGDSVFLLLPSRNLKSFSLFSHFSSYKHIWSIFSVMTILFVGSILLLVFSPSHIVFRGEKLSMQIPVEGQNLEKMFFSENEPLVFHNVLLSEEEGIIKEMKKKPYVSHVESFLHLDGEVDSVKLDILQNILKTTVIDSVESKYFDLKIVMNDYKKQVGACREYRNILKGSFPERMDNLCSSYEEFLSEVDSLDSDEFVKKVGKKINNMLFYIKKLPEDASNIEKILIDDSIESIADDYKNSLYVYPNFLVGEVVPEFQFFNDGKNIFDDISFAKLDRSSPFYSFSFSIFSPIILVLFIGVFVFGFWLVFKNEKHFWITITLMSLSGFVSLLAYHMLGGEFTPLVMMLWSLLITGIGSMNFVNNQEKHDSYKIYKTFVFIVLAVSLFFVKSSFLVLFSIIGVIYGILMLLVLYPLGDEIQFVSLKSLFIFESKKSLLQKLKEKYFKSDSKKSILNKNVKEDKTLIKKQTNDVSVSQKINSEKLSSAKSKDVVPLHVAKNKLNIRIELKVGPKVRLQDTEVYMSENTLHIFMMDRKEKTQLERHVDIDENVDVSKIKVTVKSGELIILIPRKKGEQNNKVEKKIIKERKVSKPKKQKQSKQLEQKASVKKEEKPLEKSGKEKLSLGNMVSEKENNLQKDLEINVDEDKDYIFLEIMLGGVKAENLDIRISDEVIFIRSKNTTMVEITKDIRLRSPIHIDQVVSKVMKSSIKLKLLKKKSESK